MVSFESGWCRARMSVAGFSLLTATRRGGEVILCDLQVEVMREWIWVMFWMRVAARVGSILRGAIKGSSSEVILSMACYDTMLREWLIYWSEGERCMLDFSY